MTAFHVAGLVIIAVAWVWIFLAMRLTWPAVRAYLRGDTCGFIPPVRGYAPCTRKKGHDGPCAHPTRRQ